MSQGIGDEGLDAGERAKLVEALEQALASVEDARTRLRAAADQARGGSLTRGGADAVVREATGAITELHKAIHRLDALSGEPQAGGA